MLNSAVTYFFYADKTQFESLNVDTAEKEISIINDDIIKFSEQNTIRLIVNNKNQNR